MKEDLFMYLQEQFGINPKDFELEAIIYVVQNNSEKCPDCNGMGLIIDGKYSEDCMKCKGIGRI